MNLDKSDYYPKSNLDDDDEIELPQPERVEPEEISEPATAPVITSESDEINEMPELYEYYDEEPSSRAVTAISHFLSWILVPMFMPVYGIILCFSLTVLAFTGFGTRLVFTLITAAFNVVVPAIIILILKKLGFIRDIGLNNRQERFIPYIVSIVCLIGTAVFMHFKGAPTFLVMFFMGGAATGIAEVVINRWWKISVHAAGIAGIVALLLYILQSQYTMPSTLTWLMISIGAAGLLGSARIWLGRHTLWQVLAGYAVGFCGVYFIMLI